MGLTSKISRSESRGNILGVAEEAVATNGLGRFAQEGETFEQVRLPIEGEVGTECCGRPEGKGAVNYAKRLRKTCKEVVTRNGAASDA